MLAEKVPEIDLILGGHSHTSIVEKDGGTPIAKCGSEFRKLNVIDIEISDDGVFTSIKQIENRFKRISFFLRGHLGSFLVKLERRIWV